MATKVGKITRKKGRMYFVKGNGDVMETTMNRKGGKKGRHYCKTQPKGHQKHSKPAKTTKKKGKAQRKKHHLHKYL